MRALMTEHTDINVEDVDNDDDRAAEELVLPDEEKAPSALSDKPRRVSLHEVTIAKPSQIEMSKVPPDHETEPTIQPDVTTLLEENTRTIRCVSLMNQHHTVMNYWLISITHVFIGYWNTSRKKS
jgi:hypothetical protein